MAGMPPPLIAEHIFPAPDISYLIRIYDLITGVTDVDGAATRGQTVEIRSQVPGVRPWR
jgi:hypothetical protein